jgi:hypothetical protein
MPLKCLGCSVPAHCFVDYFTMSGTMCLEAGCQFHIDVADLYMDKYLCTPDGNDLRSICQFHKEAHVVKGMVGSLNCLHTYWDIFSKHSKEKKGGLLLFWKC